MKLQNKKKIYFASDNHLGAPADDISRVREKKFVNWLDFIKKDASSIFLLGDLFDFWFEYKTVVPKGFTRVLGKLAEISDSGIKINFFVGNHDLWMRDYFQKELGIEVHHKPLKIKINESKFFLAHGDGLGPGDIGYKLMKGVFTNPVSKWFFRWLHPDIGVSLGKYLSQKNKLISGDENVEFLGEQKEPSVVFSKSKLKEEHFDYLIFGHRHLPIEIPLNEKAKYVNLGDWIRNYTYGVFDGKKFELKVWNNLND